MCSAACSELIKPELDVEPDASAALGADVCEPTGTFETNSPPRAGAGEAMSATGAWKRQGEQSRAEAGVRAFAEGES